MIDKMCLSFVVAWFLIGGIGHFAATEFFASIVPPYIPRAQRIVEISGVFELLGVLGLLYAPTRKVAAAGLFLLTVCVTPANVYMWQNAAMFPAFPPTVLFIRLILQIVLLACIVRCANSKWRQAPLL